MMMEKTLRRNASLGMGWAIVALATALAFTGCTQEGQDASLALEEPAASDAQATEVPASAATTASLEVATWRYQQSAEGGVLVRGFVAGSALDDEPLARFWVTPSSTFDGMIAHGSGDLDVVALPNEGGVRGGSAQLRAMVAAFRADVEAAEKAAAKDGVRNVNDDVYFCLGQQATFTTWFFGNTSIAITNPSYTTSVRFSFAAGLGYEENWVPPRTTRVYPRIFGGFNVTVTYRGYSGGSAPCGVRVQTW